MRKVITYIDNVLLSDFVIPFLGAVVLRAIKVSKLFWCVLIFEIWNKINGTCLGANFTNTLFIYIYIYI